MQYTPPKKGYSWVPYKKETHFMQGKTMCFLIMQIDLLDWIEIILKPYL